MTVFVRHPVDNPRITQPFGVQNSWEAQPHMGIDYGAPEGTPIYAPCDGFVVWASGQPFGYGNTWEMIPGSGNSGNCVIIQPPAPHTAMQTSFSHMSGITVQAGQWVTAGTLIGFVGNTGFSFGAHLHWEAFIDYAEGVYPPGTYWGRVNPLDYFTTSTVVPLGTGGKGSTNPSEDDELNNDQNNALADIWRKSQRFSQILEALDRNVNGQKGLTAAVKALAEAKGGTDVDKTIRDAIESTASTHYVKSKEDATVYALIVETGKLRPVTFPEWQVAEAAGIPLRVVPQKVIDNAPKEAK